ncbi:tetratricopeptide (TPR) repeat protein [Mycobacteroides chelonae]|nr:tetratricopeptide (TPR) repeat protein [Mycobacteroides chelonae]
MTFRTSAVTALTDAAFGSHSATWPLVSASTPEDAWLRAVALGGAGRYGAAHAELSGIAVSRPGRLASLALSTRASHVRQLGWHAQARGLDGRALAMAGADAEARSDALVGLSADALGLARFSLAHALLERAEPLARHGDARWPWRLPLRLAWVRAELAMVSGDGARSLRYARTAEQLTLDVPSARHQVKTSMVLAAALSSAGDLEESAAVAARALQAATVNELVPLRWALAAMLASLPSFEAAGQRREELVAIRRDCAAWIAHAGGRWRLEAVD